MNARKKRESSMPIRLYPVFESLFTVLEAVNDCVIIANAAGIIHYMNRSAEVLTGWDSREAIGRRLDEVLRLFEESNGLSVGGDPALITRLRNSDQSTGRYILIGRTGRRISVGCRVPVPSASENHTETIVIFSATAELPTAAQNGKRWGDGESSNRMRDRFMSMIIHEIRNSLTVISSFAQDLLMRDDVAEDVRTEAGIIKHSSTLVLRLLRDVLEARDSVIGFDMVPATVDLHGLVRHAVRSLQHDIDAKQIDWSLELSAEHHVVRADADRLQQVLWNLVSNAVKFTPAGGGITIRSSNPDAHRIRVEVTDTGIGIDPERLPHLFDLYDQGSLAPAQGYGGWGIGLAVSKAIVDAHQGELSAWSAGTDRGATFVLELAVAADTGSIDVAKPISDTIDTSSSEGVAP